MDWDVDDTLLHYSYLLLILTLTHQGQIILTLQFYLRKIQYTLQNRESKYVELIFPLLWFLFVNSILCFLIFFVNDISILTVNSFHNICLFSYFWSCQTLCFPLVGFIYWNCNNNLQVFANLKDFFYLKQASTANPIIQC